MELRQLETFVTIVREGGFTRAAEALSITQPAATRQIAALEAEFKTRLFDRLGRSVALTPAGEELFRYAQQMLRLNVEAQTAIRDVVAGYSGRLAVGASSTAATYLLPALLRLFRESHSEVELSVRTGPSGRIAEMVAANEVDLGVVMDHRHSPELTEIHLADYSNVVVAAPDYPINNALLRTEMAIDAVNAATLSGAPMILMQHPATLRIYVDTLLAAMDVVPSVSIEVDSVEAIKMMVEAQLGVSILPLIAVAGEVAAGRLLALPISDAPSAVQPIAAIYRKDKFLSRSMKAFIRLLQNELAMLIGKK